MAIVSWYGTKSQDQRQQPFMPLWLLCCLWLVAALLAAGAWCVWVCGWGSELTSWWARARLGGCRLQPSSRACWVGVVFSAVRALCAGFGMCASVVSFVFPLVAVVYKLFY